MFVIPFDFEEQGFLINLLFFKSLFYLVFITLTPSQYFIYFPNYFALFSRSVKCTSWSLHHKMIIVLFNN